MSYLETVGKNAKKAFEDLKDVKHKKIKKVLDNYNQSILKNSNKICLLYTSPSPRDATLSRMPSSA